MVSILFTGEYAAMLKSLLVRNRRRSDCVFLGREVDRPISRNRPTHGGI